MIRLERLTCQDFPVRCYKDVTSVDDPIDCPHEGLDAIRDSATIEGVLGWSNQLAESRGHVRHEERGVTT